MTSKPISTYSQYEQVIEQQMEDWARAEEEEDTDFRVVRKGAFEDSDPRPLLVWVHPGDACESDNPDTNISKHS